VIVSAEPNVYAQGARHVRSRKLHASENANRSQSVCVRELFRFSLRAWINTVSEKRPPSVIAFLARTLQRHVAIVTEREQLLLGKSALSGRRWKVFGS
jgi:hypothetical protein